MISDTNTISYMCKNKYSHLNLLNCKLYNLKISVFTLRSL